MGELLRVRELFEKCASRICARLCVSISVLPTPADHFYMEALLALSRQKPQCDHQRNELNHFDIIIY